MASFSDKILELLTRESSRVAISICCGLVMMSVSGSVYMFSTYANSLREVLGYSQTEISVISSIGQSLFYVGGVVWGPLIDSKPPSYTSIPAGLMGMVGYMLMGLTQALVFKQSHFLLFTFYYFLVGFGTNGLYMLPLSVNVKIASVNYRGLVVGMHAALVALSAALLNFATIWFTNSEDYLYAEHLLYFLCGACGVAAFLGSFGLFNSFKEDPHKMMDHLPDTERWAINDSEKHHVVEETNDEEDEEGRGSEDNLIKSADIGTRSRAQSSGSGVGSAGLVLVEEKSPLMALLSNVDFWLLFFCLGIAAGSQLMYFTHVSSMVKVLGIESLVSPSEIQKISNRQVSLLSLSNFLGRFLTGLAGDFCFSRYQFRRRWWVPISMIFVCLSQVCCLLVANVNLITLCTVSIGFSYGVALSAAPITTGEVFQLQHFGLNWGIMQVGPGALAPLTNLLFGAIYDRNTGFDQDNSWLPECVGHHCYHGAFLVTGSLCLIATLVAFYFGSRTAFVNSKYA
eukprot:Lithocolla_globosa_v1_NODE_2226_length_2101_cov_10.636852.p1 type:complete len:513 gc:universal NODE_2226_length_2101_cov_10.636852:1652-114(-)